jgi:hypothetical protein
MEVLAKFNFVPNRSIAPRKSKLGRVEARTDAQDLPINNRLGAAHEEPTARLRSDRDCFG